MKKIEEKIDGVDYVIKELPADVGIPLIFNRDGSMDNLRFAAGSVEIAATGEAIDPTKLNTGTMVKIINRTLRLNGLADAVEDGAPEEGN